MYQNSGQLSVPYGRTTIARPVLAKSLFLEVQKIPDSYQSMFFFKFLHFVHFSFFKEQSNSYEVVLMTGPVRFQGSFKETYLFFKSKTYGRLDF